MHTFIEEEACLKRTSSSGPDREEEKVHSRPRKGLDERHEFGKVQSVFRRR